ncbi:MAG: LysR family transcriptional regulator [Burkholderiaceae bacterium]|nr:LysR family transcriptional regulator [Burkholderiaceae bacterium]
MNKPEPALSWEHLRYFLAVMEHGTLSAAARKLGATQPTMGRHIDALEAEIGGPLFTRSRHGLLPNDKARALLPHAQTMASAADALLRSATGDADAALSGAVRISASEMMGSEVLPEILARFAIQHPGVHVELLLSDQPADLLRRDADIAVRMFRPTQGALRAARAGRVGVALYAHSAYAARKGMPKTLADARSHVLIGYDRNPLGIQAVKQAGLALRREDFSFRCDRETSQLAALRAGYGIGACQQPIARRDPQLLPLFQDKPLFELEVWVAMHAELRAEPRMSALFRHLQSSLRAYCESR